MTVDQLSCFMERFNIQSGSWYWMSNISTIIFDSSTCEFLNNTTQYCFDLENELIKTREYFFAKDPIGKTYTLKRISDLEADAYYDIANIAGFSIGKPIQEKPNPLTSFLYKTDLGV